MLIRSGLNEGLIAPISFDSTKGAVKSETEDGTVVTVRIQTAVRFIMELDQREKQAFPDKAYEKALLYRSREFLEDLKEDGYTGEDPQGPTMTWVDNSRLEALVVTKRPLTWKILEKMTWWASESPEFDIIPPK